MAQPSKHENNSNLQEEQGKRNPKSQSLMTYCIRLLSISQLLLLLFSLIIIQIPKLAPQLKFEIGPPTIFDSLVNKNLVEFNQEGGIDESNPKPYGNK